MKKLPFRKFVLAHSEDVYDGRTLLMNIGESRNFDVDVITYEIDNDGEIYKNFALMGSAYNYKPFPGGLGALKKKDKKKILSSLFSYGIKDER